MGGRKCDRQRRGGRELPSREHRGRRHFLDEDGAATERYVESPAYTVIEVSPCETTLLFPFVTNKAGFDTGIAITNTSEGSGSCTISYHGVDAPDDWELDEIAAERQEIFLLSAKAMGFQGYIMADCGFQDGHGFGFVSNGYPTGPSTLAQGYLAVCTTCK